MLLKRIGIVLAAVGLAAFGADSVANAQTSDYPPSAPTVVVDNTNPPPGGTITITINNCRPGENVTFSLPPQAPVTIVCNAAGVAVASLSAPLQPGTYPGTVVLQESGVTLAFSITVAAPTGGLPATGSDGTQSGIWYGLGLLGLGAGLFGVSQVRRRQTRLA